MASNNHYWLLTKLMCLAFVLQILPMPSWLFFLMPLWPLILFIYWLIFYGRRFYLLSAFTVGILLDVLLADILGQNALAMVLSVGMLIKYRRSFLTASIFGQQLFILLAGFIYVATHLAIHIALYGYQINWQVFIAPVSSTFIWFIISFFARKI